MAVSLQRRKQNSKGFELVFHEERLRNVERAQREEAVQVTVSHAHERFGNARMAGALGVESPVTSLFAGGALPGLDIDATPLAGESAFLHDQLSLALVGFDTGLLGPDASNAAVQDAMEQSAAAGESAMRAQLNRDGEATDYDASHPAVRGMHSRGGSPLPAAVASRLGAAFGHDFSHVRIHTDAAAAAASEALNARAFAVGAEIWFGRGAYNPETSEGTAILAHELTHVVQADEGRLPSASGEGLSVSSPTDAAEREAYANERSIPAMLDMAAPDLSPMTGSAEASGVSTQPAADHHDAPVVDGQGLDGAVMRQLDWKRKRQRPGILDVGMDPPGKAVGSLLSGDGLKFDARFGNQNAGGAIQGNIGGKDGNSFKATGQVSDGANRLGVQANVGENGVDIAANANVQVGDVNVGANLGPNGITGSASVDGLPVNGRVDVGSNGVSGTATVDAGPVKGKLELGPNGVTGAAAVNAGPLKGNVNLGPNGVTGAANLSAGPLKVDAKVDKDGVKLDPKLDGKDPKDKDGKEEGKDGAKKDGEDEEKEEGKDGDKGGDTAKLGPDGKPLPGGDAKGPPGAAGAGGGGGGGGGLGLGVAGGPGEELLGGLANGLVGGAFGMGGPQAVARSLGTLRLPGFDLDKKEEEGLKKQTGMTPAQHQQAIQGHVDRLRTQVDQMRAGLKRYAEDKALALDAELTAARDALTGDMGSARGKISGAYAGARAGLGTAASEAMGTVTAAAASAREKLATSLPAQQARLTALVAAGRTSVDGFGAPWKTKFGEELEVGAKAFDATAKLCAGELAATKAAIVNTWGDTGNALERAENEARRKAAGKGVDDAVRDFGAGGAQKAAAARGQKPTYDAQVDSALTTVRDTLTNLETTGRAQLIAANTRAGEQITTQTTEAQTAITGAKTRAEGALTTAETAALGEVDNVQAQQAQNLTSACESAKANILGADGSLQERYAQWFDGVLAGIPADQATTYEQVKEFLDGKERELPTFNATIMTELDGSCETARQTLVDAANNARTALTRLADGQAQSAANQGRQQADGLRATATQFATGILATGSAIETAFTQHIEPMAGSVTRKLTELEGQLTAALAAAKADLARQNTAYATQLRARIAAMPQTLTPMANAAAAGVYRDLSGRAQRVHSACKGMGTDESAVYNALRGLSAIGGAALEQVVWGRLFRAEGGLRAFLDDDLNDSEKAIAFAYLGGNTALGARLEIDSNMRWYGDDEAQIEKILRELSPEDLAAMQAQPQWAATRSRLMSNLGGTDLDVTRALIAGNVARADAYRLREKIDEARRSRDPDALADALAGVDPAQLAAVQQEFVNIQNKVDPEATNVPPIDPALAANQLADYATRDIQEGPRGRGGRPQTNSVTGANRDLVRALATEGRDSVSAATSRFEVERTRAGGPKMDRMEMALMAPAAIQEQLHSPDPQVRAQAEQQQNAREQAMRDQYTRQYGGASGATMDSAIGSMFSGRTDKEAQTSQRLMRNMLADGTNSPRVAADMIALGADGAGTDEAMIKRALNGMRPDEVRAMNTVYQQVHGGSVYERLGVAERDANGNKIPGRDHASNQWFNELSGDDRREVEMLLQGDERYMTSQQQLALARSQYDWQRGSESGGMGRALMDGSAEQQDLDRNFNALTTLSARMRPDGTFANSADQKEYERLCGDVGINAAQYQAGVDRTANYITTGVAIVGAVVVTAATFGSGAPAGAAMIMAAAGTAASGAISMGVNAGMKGGRYGYEQAAVDAGVTLVNTATAGAGAYMKGAQIGVNAMGKIGSGVAIDAGMGFVNGAAQTAMTDGTWDQGFVSGLGTTALGGGRQALTDAASSAVSGRIDETALGRSIDQGGDIWRSAVFKGSSNAAGAVASVAAGTAFDAARGKGPTDLGSVAEQAGTEGAKQFLMGAGGGALGSGIRRRNGQAAGAGPPAPDTGTDPHGPPPGSGSGPARDNDTPPNNGGGGADVSVDPATPRATDTSQQPVGGPPAGTTDRPPSTPSGNPDVDSTTGRQPAGTQADAAVVARQQQAHGGQGGRNDNDAHVVRNQDSGESTVTSARGVTRADDTGVATRNNDGTTDFVDTDGNRTLFLPDGGSRTILTDGTVVLRDADGKAVAVKDEVAIRLDAQGKPIAQPETPAPRPTEATREQAVFDRVDKLLQDGKLSPDQAWTIVARSGDVAAQEVALRAAESRISQDDAVITRLVDLAKEKGPDGRPAIHPDELDAVIAAPDPLRALQVLDARHANRAQDAQVKQQVDAATRADEGGGRFVDEVFDNITVGAGFAGISNEISARGNGADGRRLVVGGENPWLRANADLGQRAGESEVVGGAQPMRGTADTANKPFMAARQHAENVEINRAGAGVGVLDGKVDGVELRSQMPPGGTWHKDAAARIRLHDGVNADGSPKFRYVYANHVDLAGGAGAARDLSTTAGRDGSGPQIDPALYAQMKADGRIMMSDQGFDGSRVGPGEKVLVYGGGASGAWGAEGATRNAAEVEWLGRMAQPSDDMPSSQRDRLVGLHDTLKSARASGDPVAIQRAMGDLERFTFTEGRGNGFLPRNQREGAAFDPAMQRENGGKITRSVTDDIRTVTFETNPANGKQQIRLVGKDGQEFWADRVVLAIGQDGEAGGGPGKLLGDIKGMTPLIDTSGRDYPFPVVVGVESADGAVRVIGAAATSPSVRKRIAEGFRETADESFALQSTHQSVPTDSQGVVGSFHHAEKMIRAANRETLVRLAQADPATQQRILGDHDAAHDVKAAADEQRLAHPPELPTMESTGRSRTGGSPDAAVIPGAPRLVGAEPGRAVTTPREGDTPLIGLSGDFFDPKASGEQLRSQITEGGVPRQQRLSESERAEETRFADWVQRNVGAASDGARKLAESIGNPDQPIFEVDAMKRLLPEYGSGGKPATPEERAYRLEMNHALHPTAVAIARLGFQERLDVLARLPDGHPSKQVFVTSGGCAAGKGDLTGIVQNAMGERAKFGAVWDAAGEGDAGENAWVLRAATERGIKVVFGYAEADPVTRYQSVLERAGLSGRVVDVMTFINSYSDGAAAFKSFLDSPEYRTAVAEGRAEAFGIAPGEFNRGSLTDKSQKAYPDVKPLNQADQAFGAQHVGDPPNKQQALEASLRILEDHVRKERAAGRNPDAVARGALENAIKFLDGQPAAVRVAVLESYQRIFGGAPQ